jgi:DNA-binding CsgD family transcriptional regulator
MEPNLIDRIYECSFAPEIWPNVLDEISEVADTRGGVLFTAREKVLKWTASPAMEAIFRSYIDDGWLIRCNRRSCYLSSTRPGFLVEDDIWKRDELDEIPIYRDFLRPRGLGWSAGLGLPMPTGDNIVFSFERELEKGPVEAVTVQALDLLRPHLTRSALVSARFRLERATGATDALALIGLPAVVLDASRLVVVANELAKGLDEHLQWDGKSRMSFKDRLANHQLVVALEAVDAGAAEAVLSFPVRSPANHAAMVAHVLPVRGSVRDIFASCHAVVLLTPISRPKAPPVDLIRSLFDFTPSEARVARSLALGETVEEIAKTNKVSTNTVRTQVRHVLDKTGCARQVEVVTLLAGMSLSVETKPMDD